MSSKIFYFVGHTANCELNSGIQRVTRYLGRALGDLGRDVVFVGWLGQARAATRASDEELNRLARWHGPTFRSQGARGRPLELDPLDCNELRGSWLVVPECPYHTQPDGDATLQLIAYAHRVGLKIAFIFHDLIPIATPGYEDLRDAHKRFVQQMTLADAIIPVSSYSARDLQHYLLHTLELSRAELPPIICCLLPEEIPGQPRVEVAAEPATETISIISLGLLEPRKNHAKLLQAFNGLCAERPQLDVRLTLIGNHRPTTLDELTQFMQRNSRIRFAGFLPDEDVFSLYGECHFTVFPSVLEGYGMPITESLWFGKPVLCAKFGSMAEVAAGGGCLTVDTRSVDALTRGIEGLATDQALRRALADQATSRKMRSWRDYAGAVLNVLQDVGLRTSRQPAPIAIERMRQLAEPASEPGQSPRPS